MTPTKITVTKLDVPVFAGDWHDKPLRYEVLGPGDERQRFSTVKDAKRYRLIRSRAASFSEACQSFAKGAF
jgi:hypothetical protein